MICVPDATMQQRAKSLPIFYLDECRRVAVVKNEQWCFEPSDFMQIRKKFRKYSRSEADPAQAVISGCCDRADQY